MRLVDTQSLDKESKHGVAGGIKEKQTACSHWNLVVQHDQCAAQQQTCNRFVQKCWMKLSSCGVARRLGCACRNFKAPRQCCWATKQLLVKPVAPTTDALRQRECRRHTRQQQTDGQTALTRHTDADQRAECDTAPDAEAALPNLHNCAQVVAKQLPVGYHVIQTRTDNARRNRPHGNCAHVVGGADASLNKSFSAKPDCGNNSECDHCPVSIECERAKIQAAA